VEALVALDPEVLLIADRSLQGEAVRTALLQQNPALAGTRKTLVPSGKLTRLLATGFASQREAARACATLKSQGQACLVAGQS
jgi:ABC-type hemin transport system substrate-binding protein